MYLMYPTLCRQAFALIVCHQVGGKRYLVVDMQEPCFEGRHLTWIFLCTIPQILLYVFGFPIIGLYVVYLEKHKLSRKASSSFKRRKVRRQKSLSSQPQVKDTLGSTVSLFKYGMLYSSYSPKRWYWDAIIALRKAFMAFLTSYVSLPEIEIHYIILVLVLFIVLNEYGKPYADENGINSIEGAMLQRLDTMTLVVCLFTAWSGLFFVLYPYCNSTNLPCYALMWAVVALNVCFLFYCISLFKQRVYEAIVAKCFSKTKKKKEGEDKDEDKEIELPDINRMRSHTNPLVYNKDFMKKKEIVNPYFNVKAKIYENERIEYSDYNRREYAKSFSKAHRKRQMKRVNTIMEVKRKRTLTDDNRNGSSKPGGDNVTIKVEKEKGEKSSMI